MPVAGATGKTFSPDESGNYAVQLIKGPCTDTSECQSITITSTPGISTIEEPRLYPNPGTRAFYIDLGRKYGDVNIEVFNAIGQSVLSRIYSDKQILDFNLDVAEGVYAVALRVNDDKIYRLQLIKQ